METRTNNHKLYIHANRCRLVCSERFPSCRYRPVSDKVPHKWSGRGQCLFTALGLHNTALPAFIILLIEFSSSKLGRKYQNSASCYGRWTQHCHGQRIGNTVGLHLQTEHRQPIKRYIRRIYLDDVALGHGEMCVLKDASWLI